MKHNDITRSECLSFLSGMIQISVAPATNHRRGISHPIIFKYLYTVGLDSPHTLASSDTFIFPFIRLG